MSVAARRVPRDASQVSVPQPFSAHLYVLLCRRWNSQLGHGQRQDERVPRRMLGGLGYGVRIVQVSAGGGLVRVAHSLLLTSTGRVLSFGAGQYGALGHGYSSGKQLPDVMKPRYIECLNHVKCVCVAAGELHSAIVTSDGDVYTWGDGFCGMFFREAVERRVWSTCRLCSIRCTSSKRLSSDPVLVIIPFSTVIRRSARSRRQTTAVVAKASISGRIGRRVCGVGELRKSSHHGRH